jgi:hypothetical protein
MIRKRDETTTPVPINRTIQSTQSPLKNSTQSLLTAKRKASKQSSPAKRNSTQSPLTNSANTKCNSTSEPQQNDNNRAPSNTREPPNATATNTATMLKTNKCNNNNSGAYRTTQNSLSTARQLQAKAKQKSPCNKVINSLQRHKEANLDKNKPKKGKYSSKPKL